MMSKQGTYITAGVTAAGLLGAYYAYKVYNDSRSKIPEVWHQVGTLKDIYVYPIKSCGGVKLNTAECSLMGLRVGWLRDRVLMVVDDQNNFITARVYPELLRVETSVNSSILTLRNSEMEPVYVNLAEVVAMQKPQKAHVWGVGVPVFDCGVEASEWFSRLLDQPSKSFRLVYYASQDCRSLRTSANSIYKFRKNDTGAFPDEVSFNLINEASVDDLNTRLQETQVTVRNFRPNFVLKGAKAYDEDNWKFVKIGENVFEIIKPCTRCILTTIDPETGVRNTKTEPLDTLKSYRQIEDPAERKAAGSSPRMGLQMALRSGPGGVVSLNDTISVA